MWRQIPLANGNYTRTLKSSKYMIIFSFLSRGLQRRAPPVANLTFLFISVSIIVLYTIPVIKTRFNLYIYVNAIILYEEYGKLQIQTKYNLKILDLSSLKIFLAIILHWDYVCALIWIFKKYHPWIKYRMKQIHELHTILLT